jgi:hypothetical protein
MVFFALAGCSSTVEKKVNPNQGEVKGEKAYIYEKEEDGLLLTAEISNKTLEADDKLVIKATLKNTSGKTLHYNGRCGVPLGIGNESSSTEQSIHLSDGSNIYTVCTDMYDPNDIKEFKHGEVFNKEVTFYPKVMLNHTKNETSEAPAGTYRITFTFLTEEGNKMNGMSPIEVKNTTPSILSIKEAVEIAKKQPRAVKWMKEAKQEFEKKPAILSEGGWHIVFKNKNSQYDRIIIAVDAKTGEVKAINEQ